MGNGRHVRARRDPMLVGLEFDAKLLVIDPQIAVLTARNRFWCNGLHFLRHHADIGALAAVVAEAIVAEAVVEMAKQDDVMLERDVRTSAATAAATASSAAATTATTTARACTAAATAAAHATTAAATAAKAGVAACGLRARSPAGSDISKGVTAATWPPAARARTC